MSLVIEWNGREYDIDPGTFLQAEMRLIKQRAGISSYPTLMQGLITLDADAIAAVFWINDYRDNPDLKFGDYPGPPTQVLLDHMEELAELAAVVLGKLDPMERLGTPGSPGSPNGSDTPPPSTTG